MSLNPLVADVKIGSYRTQRALAGSSAGGGRGGELVGGVDERGLRAAVRRRVRCRWRNEGRAFDFLSQWRVWLSVDQDSELGSVSAVDPYAVYSPGAKGLGPWGSTERADGYFWLIDAERPGDHPVLARPEDGEWCRYDMSTSEFLYRVLADADFQPFGIAQYDLGTTFKPGSDGPDGQPLRRQAGRPTFADTTVPSFLIEIREPGDHQLPPEPVNAVPRDQRSHPGGPRAHGGSGARDPSEREPIVSPRLCRQATGIRRA
ncbi:hypothetical protein [Streptomyces sp. SLBN-115]|uniref:hypothetical protein n=1 Tax=Streptomyces sp. SLBN-115 TaxID=2768453 RepID=UPI00114E0AFD|nr:hypothetical protein [Streptomyces sp. SLBN-115]TQJ57750.1 hypothetical protein FBY34_5623 [Streptomyces sp. SLBN-115]